MHSSNGGLMPPGAPRMDPLTIPVVEDAAISMTMIRVALAAVGYLTLRQDVPADLPPAYADGSRVDQILTHLIGNAIKFTPAGRSIDVRAQVTADGVRALRIAVADSGCGIAPEETGRIFEYLYQGSNIQEQSRKGSGE